MTFTTTVITAEKNPVKYAIAGDALLAYTRKLFQVSCGFSIIRNQSLPELILLGEPGAVFDCLEKQITKAFSPCAVDVASPKQYDKYLEVSNSIVAYMAGVLANRARYVIIQNDENVESPFIVLTHPAVNAEDIAQRIADML